MLAVVGRDDGVLAVELIGRGDPHHLHLRVAAQFLYRRIGTPWKREVNAARASGRTSAAAMS
jgi:replication-associated recombination protein RarA